MSDRHGKYIVFCSGVGHLNEMVEKVPEWFGKIDAEPRVYKVYSDDALASADFRNFKEDHSDHLRLLYCIDMLNEGVHVTDISGVILLRPTVSPIIYKQQMYGEQYTSTISMMRAMIIPVFLNSGIRYTVANICLRFYESQDM